MFISKIKFPFAKTYCISLSNSTNRRKHIIKELSKHNIKNLQLIDAIDKDNGIVENAYSSGTVVLFPPCFRCGNTKCECDNNVLIPTQVATFFSHMQVWEEVAKQENGLYLIIEDDIKFNPYYKYLKYLIHGKISSLFSKYSEKPFLLRLGWAHNEEHTFQKIIFRQNNVKMSNPMYAVNPIMAKKLLENFKQIDTTVDIYLHKNIGIKYNNFTLYPPLAYELSWSTGDMESLIRPRTQRIAYLENQNNDTAKEELKKYDEHIDRAVNKNLLAVGHPRTGSGYTSALLKAYGLDIGHEEMGKDGIASWMFTVYDLHNPFYLNKYAKSRYFASFENIIMFARDPFTAIPSIMRENSAAEASYEFRRKHILRETNIDLSQIDNDLEKAIENYYLWSKIAIDKNKPALIVRVEYDDDILFDFLHKKGFELSMNKEEMPRKDINSNKAYKGKIIEKPLVGKEDWLNLNEEMKQKVNELCKFLGYEPLFTDELTEINR